MLDNSIVDHHLDFACTSLLEFGWRCTAAKLRNCYKPLRMRLVCTVYPNAVSVPKMSVSLTNAVQLMMNTLQSTPALQTWHHCHP